MKRTSERSSVCAFIPDIHFPFADHTALAAVLDYLDDVVPDCLFVLGDLLDAYEVSTHGKARSVSLQAEIDEAALFLAELRSRHPRARIWLHEGNHERRLVKYMMSQAKALSGLRGLSMPELLGLRRLRIEWCDYLDAVMPWGESFRVEHGDLVRSMPGATPRGYLQRRKCSGVSGHTHRLGLLCERYPGRVVSWMECGHLASPEVHREYAIAPDWHQGFGMGIVGPRECSLWPVQIQNGRVMAV